MQLDACADCRRAFDVLRHFVKSFVHHIGAIAILHGELGSAYCFVNVKTHTGLLPRIDPPDDAHVCDVIATALDIGESGIIQMIWQYARPPIFIATDNLNNNDWQHKKWLRVDCMRTLELPKNWADCL